MMINCAARLFAVALLTLTACPTWAQEARPQQGPKTEPAKPAEKEQNAGAADKLSVTDHQITLEGGPLKYQATAGTYVMKDDGGKPKASFFFVAYEKRGDDGKALDPAKRPITYVFNGGPGAAAVWLHMGTAGPRRIRFTEQGEAPPPPHEVVDNPFTWLDATDLVFIDPVGTGYSRPAAGEKQEQFSGVQEDIAWVGQFIRLYTTRNGRWTSPKFLAGESYGTTRAAGLSQHLLDQHGIALNGVILVSTVLNFQTISFTRQNDLPFVLFLPSFTATAWYQKKLPSDLQAAELQKTLKEVEAWALADYMPALAKGATLTAEERTAVAQKLARYTGLPVDVVEKADLRIDDSLFRKTLLNDTRRIIGRFDSRLVGYDPSPLARNPDFDPSFTPFFAAYNGAFNDYARRVLKYETDTPYEVLTGRVHPWNFGQQGAFGGGWLNVADNLQNAMRKNPHMKVLFASGVYDLATPYFGTDYTVSRLDLSPELRRNITQTYYPGGHMMYHHLPTLKKVHDDVKGFIEGALTAAPAGAHSKKPT